jgi:hypothetical protein
MRLPKFQVFPEKPLLARRRRSLCRIFAGLSNPRPRTLAVRLAIFFAPVVNQRINQDLRY